MKVIKTNFCQIFTSESNISSYSFEYDNYCVGINTYKDFNLNEEFAIPTIIIGWSFVKNNFDKVKISQKRIRKNLYWTFSPEEDQEINERDLKKFLNKSLKEYLPQNYKTFDCNLNGNINDHLEEIFSKRINFCFLSSNEILYVYNEKSFYGISLNSIDYTFLNKRDFLKIIINNYNLVFFNYDNFIYYSNLNEFEIQTLENICWMCSNFILNESSLHKFSPYPINEKYFVFLMNKFYDVLNCDIAKNKDILSRFNKKDQITNWLSNKIINFSNGKKLILKYSNKRTITGRINCVDKRFNPQLLPKNSELRNEIVSGFNKGQIAIFDYVSFETKLSVYLTKDEGFIEKLKNSDLHLETSKIIFGKPDITPEQRKIGKQINHAIIYGVGNDKLKSILQENKLSIKLIDKIKEFLKPIIDNSKKLSENFKEKGFIINPYNTIVYPNKEWAAYNNYVQSIAADMVVDKLFKIKELLSDKKSQFMYQVFDSFVFDIHPEELYLLENIKIILEKNGKYNFDIQYITGKNLMECTEQNIEEEIDSIN